MARPWTKPNVVLLSMARTVERDALFGWIGPIKESLSYLYTKSDSKVVLAKVEQAKSLKLIGVYKEDVRDQFLVKAGFINLDRSVDQESSSRNLSQAGSMPWQVLRIPSAICFAPRG